MASVLNRTTKQFFQSANTPDFPVVDWIVNPDLTAVAGQPVKYWLISGDTVSLADAGEQATIDAAILAAQVAADKDREKQEFDDRRVLKGLAELLVDEFNILRTIEGLPPRTFAQLRTAIQAKIDAGAN